MEEVSVISYLMLLNLSVLLPSVVRYLLALDYLLSLSVHTSCVHRLLYALVLTASSQNAFILLDGFDLHGPWSLNDGDFSRWSTTFTRRAALGWGGVPHSIRSTHGPASAERPSRLKCRTPQTIRAQSPCLQRRSPTLPLQAVARARSCRRHQSWRVCNVRGQEERGRPRRVLGH